MVVSQLIHSLLRHIEALRDVIDSKDEHLLASLSILEAITLTARRRVPAGDVGAAANVGEAWDVGLLLPAVASDQAVASIGAGDDVERAATVRVAIVVGECDGGGERCQDREEGEGGGGELHNWGVMLWEDEFALAWLLRCS